MLGAAQVALETNLPRLKATHELARYAHRELEKLGIGIVVPAETNMVSASLLSRTHRLMRAFSSPALHRA